MTSVPAEIAAARILASPLGRFAPWIYGGRSPQAEFLAAAATHPYRIFRGGNRAQPLDEPVLTPRGWSEMGALRAGDEVIAGDGTVTTVTAVHPSGGPQQVFRVTFEDGAWTRCTLDHRWRVRWHATEPWQVLTLAGCLAIRGWNMLATPTLDGGARRFRAVEKLGGTPVRCITVAHPDGTYVTRDHVVTHNSGKTTINVVDQLLRVLGWHQFARKHPDGRPVIGWCVALDWEQGHGIVLWPKFEALLPWSEVEDVSWEQRKRPSIAKAVAFKNGGVIFFKSSESGERKHQGADPDYVSVDEEIDGGVVRECQQRLTSRGGDLFASLTPLRRERWVLDLERLPFCHVTRANQLDAARAGIGDVAATEMFLGSLPARQRAVRERGDYAALEGLVYPEYSAAVHRAFIRDGALWYDGRVIAPWPLPPSWRRRAGHDFGYANPMATVVVASSPENTRHVVERCPYASGVRTSVWATAIREPASDGRPVVPPGTELFCDHDADGRAELAAHGWATPAANKEIHPGLDTVGRLLMPGDDGIPRLLLAVTPDGSEPATHPLFGPVDARALANELERYAFPPRRDGGTRPDVKDNPIKANDHACFAGDALVATPDGPRAIGDVAEGDVVETPEGPQPVLGAGFTRRANVVRVTLVGRCGGASFVCTPDHRFAYVGRRLARLPFASHEWTWRPIWQDASPEVLIEGLPELVSVYCLSVPCGAFVLACGLVAKNCDGLRYVAHTPRLDLPPSQDDFWYDSRRERERSAPRHDAHIPPPRG